MKYALHLSKGDSDQTFKRKWDSSQTKLVLKLLSAYIVSYYVLSIFLSLYFSFFSILTFLVSCNLIHIIQSWMRWKMQTKNYLHIHKIKCFVTTQRISADPHNYESSTAIWPFNTRMCKIYVSPNSRKSYLPRVILAQKTGDLLIMIIILLPRRACKAQLWRVANCQPTIFSYATCFATETIAGLKTA